MNKKYIRLKNLRWCLCLPVLIVLFVVLFSLLVIGETLVVIGEFIQTPYNSSAPRWLNRMERFINTK